MEKKIVLVTGGARSGKSQYAESRAAELGEKLLYLATGEAKDKEMAWRIAEHQKRRGENWITVEEPLEVGKELLRYRRKVDCAVVDCLTLWISNLLMQGDEDCVTKEVKGLVGVLPQLDFHLLFVTNEVGWGVVPDNPLGRQFRDLSGWANQQIGEVAHEVVLMVAGIPVILKKVGKQGNTTESRSLRTPCS